MKTKINENRGVTIIHALVGVLIFSVISSIIYSSAVGNLKSMQSETEFQQSYYTVSSAAKVFADSIKDDYIEFQVARSESGTPVSTVLDTWVFKDESPLNPLYGESNSGGDFSHDMYDIFMGNVDEGIKHSYTITATNGSNNLEKVIVDMTMATDYTIYANFRLNKSSTDTDNYYLSVKIPVERVIKKTDVIQEENHASPTSQVYYYRNKFDTSKSGLDSSKSGTGFPYKDKVYDYVDTYRIVYDSSNIIYEKGAYK